MQNKTKIKTYKLPYNFFIRDNFFNKKNLSNLLLLRNELYNSAEDVGKSLKNKRLSKKRKVIRFVNHNKLNVNKRNKNYIILKDIHKSIKKKINKKLFSDLQINPDLINKGFLNLTLTWDNRGYEIKAHTDTDRKIWSGILYLYEGTKKSGTKILKLKKNNKLSTFKTVKPKKNRLFAFKRSKNSYHSVAKSPERRFILLLNFNYKNKYYEK
tara:strand:+ start:17350 stop:17985 length:636 start_codon:yes stop_codon:yes gene_type:complete